MSSYSHTEIRRTSGRLVAQTKGKARKLTSENSNRQKTQQKSWKGGRRNQKNQLYLSKKIQSVRRRVSKISL
jgi:hypothetical protein